jgi:hypothetical protein
MNTTNANRSDIAPSKNGPTITVQEDVDPLAKGKSAASENTIEKVIIPKVYLTPRKLKKLSSGNVSNPFTPMAL